MTLTEYLQNAVTELREQATAFAGHWDQYTLGVGETSAALADHIETMLRIYRYTPDSPSLRSVGELVAAVTGSEVPA